MLIFCNSHSRQLYLSNKTEHFSYKGGCGICEHMHINALKEELAWAIDKWLQIISYIMLFKVVIVTTRKIKNKDILNLKECCMSCYVGLGK